MFTIQLGITATAGIGTNLYLAKVAMDIVAKHVKPDKNGVRRACLDEMMYRKLLWNHRPVTDFWRVGKGYSKRLEKYRIFTMGDVAKVSIENEELLYKLFGVNAELLIDHSWGWEPVTIESIKAYKPQTNSISSGQVLHCPYNYEKTKLIVKEMTELLTLELVQKNLITSQIVLTIGYDTESLINPEIRKFYNGEVTIDRYGRSIPKHAHGTINLDHKTSSTKIIMEAVMELFERIINDKLLVIQFEVDDKYNCMYNDLRIDINSINNVLTCKNWKYYNDNNIFSYTIFDNPNTLNINFVKGTYKIHNIKLYTIDYRDILSSNDNIYPMIIDKNKSDHDTITGNINTFEDSYFTASIPYDKGLVVKVDSKMVKYELTNGAFIGFPLKKGKHTIEISYIPQGYYLGLIVSIMGLLSFVGIVVYERRRLNENK